MKNLIIYSALLLCLFVTKSFAQETFESKAKIIANKIEIITQTEKNALKQEIESVNLQLEKGQITKAQADEKKLQLAQARATIIENKVAEMQMELKDLIQLKVDGKIGYKTEVGDINSDKKIAQLNLENGKYFIDKDGKVINVDDVKKYIEVKKDIKVISTITDTSFINISFGKKRKNYSESRTTLQLILALGLNNVVTNGNASNSDFRYLGSHFYEFGAVFNRRLIKNKNLFHLKYGFAFSFNNLRPTDNKFFTVNDNLTTLLTSSRSLEDSRFRNLVLTFPVHFELDFTKSRIVDGKTYLQSHKSFRLGFGGYLGTNLGTRQHVEYEDNGYNNDNISRGDFNTSNFIYGLSTYIGYKQTSLYLKYDLNPLFRNNPIKQNNVSLGIRFDIN